MSAEIGVGADAPGLGSFLNRWARGPPCSLPPVRSLSAAHGDPARQCPAAGAQLGPCRAGGPWGGTATAQRGRCPRTSPGAHGSAAVGEGVSRRLRPVLSRALRPGLRAREAEGRREGAQP